MKQIIKRIGSLLVLGGLCMTMMTGCPAADPNKDRQPTPEGWLAMTPFQMGFIAVGTNGSIGEIDVDTKEATAMTSPTTQHLRDVVAYEGILVAVGDEGTVLYTTDPATFKPQESGVEADLLAVTRWNDKFVAGGRNGTMIYSDTPGTWTAVDTGVSDTITGLAASDTLCIAVTAEGHALISENMTDWELMEYNEYYQKETRFDNIEYNGAIFSATGDDTSTGPVVVTTLSGEVWTERDLSYYNSAPQSIDGLVVTDLAWDGQQWHLSCHNGTVYTIPDCAQCNKTQDVGGGNLTAIAYNGGKIGCVGENFSVTVVDTEAVRQYSISSGTAKEHQAQGAVIIDVRGADDFAEKHIAGAVNIPLEGIESALAAQYPDKSTELIFYCTKGVRSQTALEKARDMGYATLYCLGAMDKWEYDFEP